MRRIFSIIIILTLVSCRKDNDPTEPYFKFDNVGELLLSGLKMNDTLKFSGSNGTYREYRVFKMEKLKQTVQDCSWNLGTCVTYYHYDFLKIHFIRTDSLPPPPNSPFTYSVILQMQLPDGIDRKNIPNNVKAKAIVWGNAFIDYNKIPAQSNSWISPYINYPDFYSSLQTTNYSYSTKTYNEVLIIKSENNTVYMDPLYGSQSAVNEVMVRQKAWLCFF